MIMNIFHVLITFEFVQEHFIANGTGKSTRKPMQELMACMLRFGWKYIETDLRKMSGESVDAFAYFKR